MKLKYKLTVIKHHIKYKRMKEMYGSTCEYALEILLSATNAVLEQYTLGLSNILFFLMLISLKK